MVQANSSLQTIIAELENAKFDAPRSGKTQQG